MCRAAVNLISEFPSARGAKIAACVELFCDEIYTFERVYSSKEIYIKLALKLNVFLLIITIILLQSITLIIYFLNFIG